MDVNLRLLNVIIKYHSIIQSRNKKYFISG